MTTPNVHYCPHCRSLKATAPDTPCKRCRENLPAAEGFAGLLRDVFKTEAVFVVPWSRREVKL
jgi:hypothetical protein